MNQIEDQKVLYSVENLTVLYRGRGYWHTPELNQAIAKIINHFGDRASIPPEFIAEFMNGIKRHGLPGGDGWNVWYEPCPVVKTTAMEIIVISKDMPPEIMELYPDFYKGGKFHINKAKLQRDGKAHHSRYGEYFYIDVPDSAIALPESKELLEV
jgi:hypothetical protein